MILLRGAPGAGKSTVARAFAAKCPEWDVIEVDDIKIRRYGTPEMSDEDDFLQAGRDAREALDQGRSVIVVEFFNQEHLVELTLKPIGLDIRSPALVSCWLSCDVAVAVQRKLGNLREDVVRGAHTAAAGRSAHPHEIVLDTTSLTPDEVVVKILEGLRTRRLDMG